MNPPRGYLGRSALVTKLGFRLAYYQTMDNPTAMGRTLFDAFYSLGGVYIKFLQTLLLRTDIFSDLRMVNQLKVYENVAFDPIDIERMLDSELGGSWRKKFAKVETKPFAAGSFGQVYRATLVDGSDVIIKAQRPNLRQKLKQDLQTISWAAKLLGSIRPDALVDIKMIFQEIKDTTLAEIDYKKEVDFAQDLYKRYRNHPYIDIPFTYADLSTANLITQQYVGGISVSQLIDLQNSGVDPVAYMKDRYNSDLYVQLEELGYEMIYGVFSYDYTQGDPHPGNIKLLANNKVGLIDFGLMAAAPKDKLTLLDLYRQYAKFYENNELDVEGFSLVLLRMFSSSLLHAIESLGTTSHSPAKIEALLKELTISAELVFSSRHGMEVESLLNRGKLVAVFNKVINEGNRFGLTMQYDAATLLRASHMFTVVVDSFECKKIIMPKVFNRVVNNLQIEQAASAGVKPTLPLEQSMEIVGIWMERIATRDPVLFQKLSGHLRRGRRIHA